MKVTNKLILLILLIFLSLKSFSWEVRSDSTFYIGANANYRFSKIVGYPQAINRFIKPGFGINFSYNFHQEFTLKSGISYIQSGYIYKHIYTDILGDTIGDFNTFNKYEYLGIPLEISYNLGRKRFNVFLSAGLEFNFLISQNTYANLPSDNDGIAITPVDINNKSLFKAFDFGLMAGFGCEYKIKPSIIIFVEFKYHHGLTNMLNNNHEYNFKHRAYSSGIGIRIGIPIKYSVSENI